MATITTINATDRVSDSRATINDNFAALNSELAAVAALIPQETGYEQPDLPFSAGGWPFRSIDFQIVTKYESWNFLSDSQIRLMIAEAKAAGANYGAMAVPYDNPTKYARWVGFLREAGLQVFHRSHWDLWEADNSKGGMTSITSTGGVATATLSYNHNLVTGNTVIISGANQSEYNGEFTVTVTSATTFTFAVSGSPASPATGTLKLRLTKESYITNTQAFIEAHPTFYKPGDLFGMCVEPSNANDASNYTFRNVKTSAGSFQIAQFNQFVKDQVFYANASFANIGLERQIYTWAIAPSVSLIDHGAGSWYSSGGNPDGLDYTDFIKYLGGVACLDHYQSDSIFDATTYASRVAIDLAAFKVGFPGVLWFQGEIGYHTTTTVTDANQNDVLLAFVQAHIDAKITVGMNFWVNMGSNTTSLWTDVTGTVVAGGRLAVKSAIKRAFLNAVNATKYYAEGSLLSERGILDFTGSPNMFAVITDNPAGNKTDIALIPISGKTTKTNYVKNPSFESGYADWSNYGTHGTIARDGTVAQNRTYSSAQDNVAASQDGGIISSNIVLPAGTYTFSVYAKLSSTVGNASMVVREVGGAVLGTAITQAYPGNTNFNRYTRTFTIATQKTVEILLGLGSYGSASQGKVWYDAVLLENSGSASAYFDGSNTDTSTEYYSWTGTIDDSTSQKLIITPLTGTGDVVGPSSAIDSKVPLFDGTTGKLLKDSGLTLSGNNTGDQDLSTYAQASATFGVDERLLRSDGTGRGVQYSVILVSDTGSMILPNDQSITFSYASAHNTMKSAADGVFLFAAGAGNNIKFKGGDSLGVNLWGLTDTALTYQWWADTLGRSFQNGGAVINEAGIDSDTRIEGDTDANLVFVDASTDRVGIGTSTPAVKFDINSDSLRVRTSKTPSSASDTGVAGQWCWDSGFLYICTATNTWKRVAIATW